MRKVTYGGGVSLDGFLAGPGGEIDWLHFSPDVQQIMADYWKNIDTILMGRKTYEVAIAMRPPRKPSSRKTAKRKEPTMTTYVFSRTLQRLEEPGAELVRTDPCAFVRDLKNRSGKDICLMGGSELAQTLLAGGVVDRVGLNIHPVLLGAGIPVFRDAGRRIALDLLECRPLHGGCVMATYDVRRIEG
jgi:dihydrofolate reductase